MISTPHTTESLVEGREELKSILDGVQQLPDDRREALIMRFALGMDNREIARALGRTDGATKVLLHRAVRQLEGIVRRGRRRSNRPSQGEARERGHHRLRGAAARGARRRSIRRLTWRCDSSVTLINLTELAQEELEAWELSAMRDPATGSAPPPRPSSASPPAPRWWCCACADATARASSSRSDLLDLAGRTVHDVAEEARRILPGR